MKLPNEFAKALEPIPKRIYDWSLPDCIICDLDGTLFSGCKEGYIETTVVRGIRDTLNSIEVPGPVKIFITYRRERYRGITETQLNDCMHTTNYLVYMCDNSEDRTQLDYKENVYLQHIAGRYNVLFWLEDNPAVCERMALKYGVTTLQVR